MEDRKWSDRKWEGDDGSRTVECLRGRLLAERQASRVAKENADLLGNKVQLIELEIHLKEETKLRNKAEKKLEVLMKKLNSLNISAISVEPELSSSSEKFEMSCTSSTTTSDSKDPKVDESKSQFTTPVISQNLEHNVSETTKKDSCPQGTASSKSNSNLNDPIQQRFSEELSSSSEDPKTDNHSCLNLKSSVEDNETDHGDNVDNSLALVLMSFPARSQSGEGKPLHESVSEALGALRHARETLQNSMQRRHMIQVGPT
ncbi:uncharacterized protein LOC121264159 isoform X1 [Juglans microcarpa x Juglans regia]|uniref:uncharacterized protein LOC121264159 isoform X1 n=1 Tax=Juglans microcarpa x Juglans regia TaxID=2249226 RepID=UPI001B7E36B3|nr:uncharacterized protein LOC121264159 isoform X1 [Juglans microcarpa x Juglans regia]XP_041023168.1 uncharacterized protein LOC121264159 isoform X1 [Juglans microcarpa x Juglans regia]